MPMDREMNKKYLLSELIDNRAYHGVWDSGNLETLLDEMSESEIKAALFRKLTNAVDNINEKLNSLEAEISSLKAHLGVKSRDPYDY